MAAPEKGFLIDLHLHTDVSPCGGQSLKESLSRAKACGLHLVCITDHFSTEAASELPQLKGKDLPQAVVGMEYSTRDGDFILLAPQKVPYWPKGLSTEEISWEIHRLGGIIIWAHPFRWGRKVREEILAKGLVDAIEVLNGRTSPLENEKAYLLAEAYGLPATAGSDAHFPDEIGTVANLCPRRIEDAAQLIAAIKEGLLKPVVLSRDLRRFYRRSLGIINESF